jgi:hypothetical protein
MLNTAESENTNTEMKDIIKMYSQEIYFMI